MSFLSPHWLFGATAAIVIVMLYLTWGRRRRVATSTLSLWDEAIRLRTWWTRWQWAVSLGAAVSIVLLMVLAMASPIVLSPRASARNIVAVIDTTASMKAKDIAPSRFAAVKTMATAIVDGLGPYEQMAIISVNSTTEVPCGFTEDRDLLQQAVDDLPAANGTTSLLPAIRTAKRMLAGRPNPRIYVLTDGNDETLQQLTTDSSVTFLLAGTSAAGNVAVSKLAARSSASASQPPELFFEVANFSDQPREVKASVKASGEIVQATSLAVAANARESRVINLNISGPTKVTVEIDADDALPEDNTASLKIDDTVFRNSTNKRDALIIQGLPLNGIDADLRPVAGLTFSELELARAQWDGKWWPWLIAVAIAALVSQWLLLQRGVLV